MNAKVTLSKRAGTQNKLSEIPYLVVYITLD